MKKFLIKFFFFISGMEVVMTWLPDARMPHGSPLPPLKLGSTNTKRIHTQPKEKKLCLPLSQK